jgi:hypothetical protein
MGLDPKKSRGASAAQNDRSADKNKKIKLGGTIQC